MQRIYQILLNSFNINSSLKQKVNDLIINNGVFFDSKWSKDGAKNLAISLLKAEKTYLSYEQNQISSEIFFDTMKDIEYWVKNCGGNGLQNYGWIENHLNMNLFKIGILQFQICKMNNITLKYRRLPFKKGENVIYIHIPQGEKLDYKKCVESIKSAVLFFEKYFNDFKYDYFFSESWLLYQNNYKFMKCGSNILQFQSLFDIRYSVNDESQAMERIFGNSKVVNQFESETSLQKSTKEYLKNKHNKLGVGIGIIEKEGFR